MSVSSAGPCRAHRAPWAQEVIVKALAWILTAAAVLIGADVFVMSDVNEPTEATRIEQGPTTLHGGVGGPTPPPDFN